MNHTNLIFAIKRQKAQKLVQVYNLHRNVSAYSDILKCSSRAYKPRPAGYAAFPLWQYIKIDIQCNYIISLEMSKYE